MSATVEHETPGGVATPNLNRIVAVGTGLVAANVLLILALSFTPAVELGAVLFGNYFLGIATFVATVGGGYWLASTGIEKGSMPLAGVGVTLTQAGYGLFGGTILGLLAAPGMRIPAIAITTVITAGITALVTLVVYRTDRSFERWQTYSWVLFGGGFAIGAVGFFVEPMLMLVAGACFFLGFVADLTYEIWAVKADRYASDLRNAIGIYVAVMGVFVHVLQLVLRVLALLNN